MTKTLPNLIKITLLALIILSTYQQDYEIPSLTQQIGEQIFQNNKIYLVYVVPDEKNSKQAFQAFQEFCAENKHPCALLNEKVQSYEGVRMFIGDQKEQYFLIIDAARKNKYTLPVVQGMTKVDLLLFHSKFEQGTLQPFLASEAPEKEPYLPCRKIVSSELSTFLSAETPVKVIFLFTAHPMCEICGDLLGLFKELAENMYDEKVVSFGYFDVFLNDHPLIVDEIVPYFLIYSGSVDQPTGVPAENIEDLYDLILQVVMKDVPTAEEIMKEQKNKQSQNDQREHEVLLQDIKLEEEIQKQQQKIESEEQKNKIDLSQL